MEKTEITLSFETERLEALGYYLQKKGSAQLQKELGKVLERLYEETVPKDVREYIDRQQKKPSAPKPKPKSPAKQAPERAKDETRR